MAREMRHQRDRAVRAGRHDPVRPEPDQPRRHVRPGIEPLPGPRQRDQLVGLEHAPPVEPLEHRHQVLEMQLIQRHIAPLARPDPLHRRLVLAPPSICKRWPIHVEALLGKGRRHMRRDRGSPVHQRAEDVEKQRLRLLPVPHQSGVIDEIFDPSIVTPPINPCWPKTKATIGSCAVVEETSTPIP